MEDQALPTEDTDSPYSDPDYGFTVVVNRRHRRQDQPGPQPAAALVQRSSTVAPPAQRLIPPTNSDTALHKAIMDSFPMLHGTIQYVCSSIMSLGFYTPGDTEVTCTAVAAKGVCFIRDQLSKDLCHDFKPKDKVMFSAVKDRFSENPDVWKAVVVWTSYKPLSAFKIQDWESAVSQLYTNARSISNILIGRGDVSQKSVYTERKILASLYFKIKRDLADKVTHKYGDHDLDELLNSSSELDYIGSFYGSVANYIAYHSTLFKASKAGSIFPARSRSAKGLDEYLKVTLPSIIKGEASNGLEVERGYCQQVIVEDYDRKEAPYSEKDETEEEIDVYSQTGESLNLEGDQQDGDEQNSEYSRCSSSAHSSEMLVFELEKGAVTYFHSELKRMQEEYGYVCCLSSNALEKVLDNTPEPTRTYIINTYTNLTSYIQYHDCVFIIGQASTVFVSSKKKLKKYLSSQLRGIIPCDICRTGMYEKLVKQHGAGASCDTLNVSIEETGAEDYENSPLKSSSEEIYFSDEDVENIFFERKVLEMPAVTTMDAHTQTLSTGPIMSMLQCIE